jgi:hypothetical protein
MRTVDDFAKIRQADRDGFSSRQIAKQFGVGRDTIRKALQHAEPPPYTLAHLKDRLNHYAKATKAGADSDAWANNDRNCQICGDIGNHKKHGHNQNHSGLSPQLVPEIVFDTSRSGLLEIYFDGATKHRELLVSNAVPIPYRVDIADGVGTVIGDAANIIRAGFDHWLPLIHQLGILAGAGRENAALRDILFPGQTV